MTKVIDIINQKKAPFASFELVPPLKGSDINKLYGAIEPLMEFAPPFINITFHRDEVEFRQTADGTFEKVTITKRPGSVAIAAAIMKRFPVEVVPHLICGGASKHQIENDLIDQVVGGMKAEIPDAMIESRIEELVQDFQYRISQQGLKLEQYLQYMGMTMDQFKEQFREQADKQVKMRLAMEAVVAKESIEATEEEFEAEIKRIADAYQMEADKVKSLVDAAAVKKDLAVNKAIDFVKSKANIVAGAAEEKKPAKKTTRKTTKKAAAKKDEEPKEEENKGE